MLAAPRHPRHASTIRSHLIAANAQQIREDVGGSGVHMVGVTEFPVASLEECLHYLELGEQNRIFAFTHLNAHSSRSHAVVMLTVVKVGVTHGYAGRGQHRSRCGCMACYKVKQLLQLSWHGQSPAHEQP